MNDTVISETIASCLSEIDTFASGILTFTLSLIGLVENVAVIIFILIRDGFLNVPSNVFLLSLATADGLMCAVCTPIYLLNLFHWPMFEIFTNVGAFVSLSTIGSVFLLNLDKFVSVKWSLRYTDKMTVFRAVLLVAAIWTAAFVMVGLNGVILLTGEKWLQWILKYILLITMIIVLLINVYLFKKSREHRRRIKEQLRAVCGNLSSLQQDFRATKTIFFITGSFFIGWLPVNLVLLLLNRFTDPCSFYGPFAYAYPVLLANAALDPVIYCFRSEEFKRTYVRFIQQLCSKIGVTQKPAKRSAFVIPSRVRPVVSPPAFAVASRVHSV